MKIRVITKPSDPRFKAGTVTSVSGRLAQKLIEEGSAEPFDKEPEEPPVKEEE